MEINIIIFGQLTDVLGEENLVLKDIADTDSLAAILNKKYPGLSDRKYRIAVNKKIIAGNTILTDNSTIALMPAFSGG